MMFRIVFPILCLVVFLTGGYAFALSCSFPYKATKLSLSSVTIDGVAQTNLDNYKDFEVHLQTLNGHDVELVVSTASESDSEAYHCEPTPDCWERN